MGMWKGTDFDKTCGDCIHADICEHNPSLEFNRENIAWCNSFKDKIDVVEVRHGEWKGKPIAGMCTVRCSVCGMAFSENSGRWIYCPNYGAKMDGKRKEGAE